MSTSVPKLHDLVCSHCGKSFRARVRKDSSPNRFCSLKCMGASKIGTHSIPPCVCVMCGKEFWKKHLKPTQTCSSECKRKYISQLIQSRPDLIETRIQNGKNNKGTVSPKRVVIKKVCRHCRKDFVMTGKATFKYRESKRFCSTKCWYAFARTSQEKSPYWRAHRPSHMGANWKEQSRLARERDNHACRVCHKHQAKRKLDVHHITPRRLFETWEQANRLENLITLCAGCHKKAEWGIISIQRILV